MPKQQFLDAPGGDTISYVTVTDDGYRFCPFTPSDEDVQKNFDKLPHKKCREDDILLCSYPKTGTNWLWEMICMVLLKQSKVTGGTKSQGMLEALPEEVQDAMPSRRVLNSHVKVKYLPKEAREKKIKCILICRNPKDTVVSFYNHTKGITVYEYDGAFENYLQMFMRGEVDYGSYPGYLLEWQQAIRDNPDWPVYVIYYEDMKKISDGQVKKKLGLGYKAVDTTGSCDCYHEMKKLLDYLEIDVEDGLLREIVDNCRMDKIKQGKLEQMTPEVLETMKKVLKGGWTVYRKGIIGDWKNWFTDAQNELFESWWTDNTKELDMFQFKYE